MNALRLGIIGTGRHGARYARHAAGDVEGLTLTAICRRNADEGRKQAGELGCDFVDDAFELINRADVDVVALVTIPSLLPDLVEAAIRAGKKLLIEKPVAPDLESGRRMLERIRETGTYCLAGHTLRFNVVVKTIRELIPSLGRIDSLVFTQRFPPQRQIGWLDEPDLSGGGNILHTGVHCFDLVRYLTGLHIDSVACTAQRVHTRATEDNFGAVLRLSEEGSAGQEARTLTALVTCSRSTDSRNGSIEVSGERGQLAGDHVLNTLHKVDDKGSKTIELPMAAMTVAKTLRQLVDDVSSGDAPMIGFDDGLYAVAVAEACYAADASGGFEKVARP